MRCRNKSRSWSNSLPDEGRVYVVVDLIVSRGGHQGARGNLRRPPGVLASLLKRLSNYVRLSFPINVDNEQLLAMQSRRV